MEALMKVPGVADARSILYVPATLERRNRHEIVYLIGDDTGGVPLDVSTGARPLAGEILLEATLADALTAPIGSRVRAFGRTFRVSGEVDGLASILNSVAFVRRQDLARALGATGLVNYVLITAATGASASDLAARIAASQPGTTASTRGAFARSERRVVRDMTTDIVRGMILAGFVLGVAVAGLVAYSTTLSQLRDYAVLRALGLGARRALVVALTQIGATIAAAFALALVAVWALEALLPRLSPALVLVVRTGDIAQTAVVAVAVTALAAAVPVVRIARIDPASVFRR